MIDHERALELAATALDFELSPADHEALTAHLDTCEPCRQTSQGLLVDAAALAGLDEEDAPTDLRRRILGAAAEPGDSDAVIGPGSTRHPRPTVLRLPARLRYPAVLVAAAAVIVAVIGGTLAWRTVPDGGIAVVEPSDPTPSDAGSSGDPGGPEPTSTPAGPSHDLVTAWAPSAELTADESAGGVVGLRTSFQLASVDGTPAAELARRLTVQPPLTLNATPGADGRVRLTPAEPLAAGAVYRFTLAGAQGQTIDSWAFQARQPLRVISTLPADTQTDVPLDTGIEVTFDQDGVVDAASHVTIEPKVDGRFEVHDRVLVFVPSRLAPATLYTVTVRRGITVEPTGEALADDVRFRFETAVKAGSAPKTTIRFSSDLFESATADRPTIALWSYTDWSGVGKEPKPPNKVRLEVYRLADQTEAIKAFQQLRSFSRWSRWNTADRVPTKGLTRVARLDARLTNQDGTLWTRLPERLSAGWYLVQHPAPKNPTQAILQVTDLAGYLLVSETRTLVWINDLDSKAPVARASVSAEGAQLGRTSANGTLIVDTPSTLLPDVARPCPGECEPVVTVTAGRRSMFLPATGVRRADGGNDFDTNWFAPWNAGDTRYWRLFHTDRMLYRRTDTVNVWGVLRDRTTGKVPAAVTVRLVVLGQEDSAGPPPIAILEAAPRETGAFSGSLALKDLPEGTYGLELVVGDDVISSQEIRVDRILKPAYRLEVLTGRRVYVAGDRIRVTAKASFYEGTPVPGVRLTLGGFLDASPTTDATGTAIVRGVARSTDESDGSSPSYETVYLRPARAEEGEIEAASRDFVVFPSPWTVDAESEIRANRFRFSGSVHVVDADRLEAEVAGGASIWGLDPKGAPVRGRTVRATYSQIIPVRKRIGTRYDFIEKRTVPVYEYSSRELTLGTLRFTTDSRGRFAGSVGAAKDRDYVVRITIADPTGHRITATTYASSGQRIDDNRPASPPLNLTDASSVDDGFRVGDKIDLTMREPGRATADRDRHLFYLAQNGLRDVTVRASSRFVTTFPEWAPPNVLVGAVRFTGSGYIVSQDFYAGFRASTRAISVGLRADKDRYGPGDQVNLAITTRDAAGRALPATVVLRAVDEKLYSIGGAESIDPLQELYAPIGDGIRATYSSHAMPVNRCGEGCGDTAGGGGEREDFRDAVLFQAVDTGADGRASVAFELSDDLTSWRVSASAIGAGLEAGEGSIQVPVGLPFFVDTVIAPQYLLADRPSIQVRGFGTSLEAGARVTFAVDADSLGLHVSGLRAAAFEAVTVPLPELKLGTHSITVTASTGSGASTRRDRLTRSFQVVASRLVRTRTTYRELSGSTRVEGGADLTEIVVADAGAGRQLPILLGLASEGSARLERALAADLAASIITERFGGGGDADPSAPTFDGNQYQRGDGGIGILPYASSDLEVSALAALVAPDRFDGQALRTYLRTIVGSPTETRERRNYALAGLAGLGAAVLPDIRSAAADGELTIRERLMLGLGAAALGDAATARSVAVSLVERLGEAVGDQARLRAGDDSADVTAATALMAMLLAANRDPVATRYWTYVEANPSSEAPYALHAIGYVERMLEHQTPERGSFAYDIDGQRRVVDLGPGDNFRLTVTKAQLATLSIEPLDGAIGVTSSWREPAEAAAFKKDPDVQIKRIVAPAGTVRARDLVVVDLRVTFGPKAAAGCHRVTELVPSGLVPVGVLRGWTDPTTGEAPPQNVTYPEEQTGQRVIFCAEPTPRSRTARLRYIARVITPGRYEWEPAIVESRSSSDRAAVTPHRRITIR